MDNFVGKRLDGRYEIQEVIGVGGMAVVYKAYDNIDDRIVAVKILKDEFLANEEFRRKFKNESKAIAVLNHPNIVKVYDVSFGEKIQYIVMEYIDGITLKEYIKTQGCVDWKEAVHFEAQILKALQHAHDKGIIHRDIKPQNIILLQNGNIKVTDFGIARFARSDTRTMTEGAIGSVHYISPEQARGDVTDEKADIYSAGVVLYEMITGKVPFQGDSAVSIAIMQLQKDAEMPRTVNAELPVGLEQITMRAMQKNPRERYQSAAEMLMDINELVMNPAINFEYSYVNGTKYTPVQDNNYENTIVKGLELDEELENSELAGEENDDLNDDYYKEKYGIRKNPDKKAADSKKKKIIIASVIGAVAIIILAIVLGISMFSSVKVPNFVGLNYEEEIKNNDEYKSYKFNDIVYSTNYDTSKYEEGEVIKQDPAANTNMRKSKKITLTVASESEGIEIPDLSGLTKTNAQIELKEKGFKNIVFVERGSNTVSEGIVIETSPSAGSKIKPDEELTVYISVGSSFAMTDLIGMNKSDALKWLNEYKEKFDISVDLEYKDSNKAKDIVIEQSVTDGSTVKYGASITLTLSSGTAPTTKPTTQATTASTTQATDKISKVTIPVQLPNDGGDGTLKVYLDNKLVDQATVKCAGGTYNVSVEGSGATHILSVEVNGEEVYSGNVNFNTGTFS